MAEREQQALLTVEDFEALASRPENHDRRLELIHGAIVEKAMPTQLHGRIAALVVAFLVPFVRARNLGHVEVEVRYHIPDDAHNARQPDVAFFADAASPAVKKGPVQRLPDLAVEVKSPDDSYLELREKAIY